MPPSLQWSSSGLSPSLERAQQQQEEMDEAADEIAASVQQPAKRFRAKTVKPKLAKKSEESQEPEPGTTSTQGKLSLMPMCILHRPTL